MLLNTFTYLSGEAKTKVQQLKNNSEYELQKLEKNYLPEEQQI